MAIPEQVLADDPLPGEATGAVQLSPWTPGHEEGRFLASLRQRGLTIARQKLYTPLGVLCRVVP